MRRGEIGDHPHQQQENGDHPPLARHVFPPMCESISGSFPVAPRSRASTILTRISGAATSRNPVRRTERPESSWITRRPETGGFSRAVRRATRLRRSQTLRFQRTRKGVSGFDRMVSYGTTLQMANRAASRSQRHQQLFCAKIFVCSASFSSERNGGSSQSYPRQIPVWPPLGGWR